MKFLTSKFILIALLVLVMDLSISEGTRLIRAAVHGNDGMLGLEDWGDGEMGEWGIDK